MTKLTSILTASVLLFGVATTTAVVANAQVNTDNNQSQPAVEDGARRGRKNSAVREAIKNNDYDAFVTALNEQDGERAEELKTAIESESDFALLVEAMEARKNDDTETFDANMTQLGLPTSVEREAQKAEMQELKEQIDAAIEASDFDTFAELVAQTRRGEKVLEKVTAENFTEFQEKHAERSEQRGQRQQCRQEQRQD